MARRAEPRRRWALALLLAAALPLHAQELQESSEVARAYDLENAGKYREAAQLFRGALRAKPTAGALLGLERTYDQLHISDSLLPVLDSLIARQPHESLFHGVKMRTLQILRREDELRRAFEGWEREMPRDPSPYREYARALIALGRPVLADSVVQLGRRVLGHAQAFAFETAQLRAAEGRWTASAEAWREALADTPYLSGAASFALAPTPAAVRDEVRTILASTKNLGSRRTLAELELDWGRPQEAWDALRVIVPDTTAATAWTEFGDRALVEEHYTIAREAFTAALAVRRTPEVALHAATAALRSGAAANVLTLLPFSDVQDDPHRLARDYLPLHVAALSALGRPAEAEALVQRYDRSLDPGQRSRLSRQIASAYIRNGDLARARAALGGETEADSSSTFGWLALYEGRLADARALMGTSRDPNPEFAFAMGVISRTHGDDGAALGAGFLALARGDTGTAASRFIEAADVHREAAPALLLEAARLRALHGDDRGAMELWSRIVEQSSGAPEAAEAELEWARVLRRRGDRTSAIAHLEHLILGAPDSALAPQARRELEAVRANLPPR